MLSSHQAVVKSTRPKGQTGEKKKNDVKVQENKKSFSCMEYSMYVRTGPEFLAR